ncbi:ATP-binding cassette domain-containing protein [Ammonifex thiophilus]|uniref:ATP-binding cassette domain-containing protein n=1 Tax=Ammonifex thiophilus TaxID=444093 RepID=A0A3D8P462_9THEO|nr:ATP-binding cassette domain-containing protein [Ammonifex thiophilus]RDV82449.1 ATP-binding cassette domain-containing protein [Ammonifex thiophilus]
MASVIEVENLVKDYGKVRAVDGVSFQVEEGEIFGFLGPNGAGKSTTIKILCTLLKPTGGKARIAGHDVEKEPDRVRRQIGIVFQDNSLDDRLTAAENLYLHGLLYGLPRKVINRRIEEMLEMVDLAAWKKEVVRNFSGGMRRRLEIARGLMHSPQVLFLDEPTVGLDPQTRAAIWDYIHRLRREEKITVFMTTHYMEEAENCDRIAIIDFGRIKALDTPERLKQQLGGDVITLVPADGADLGPVLTELYGLEVKPTGEGLCFRVKDGASFIPRLAAELGERIKSIHLRRPTLDDVFLSLTGRAIREEKASAAERLRYSPHRHRH